MAKDKKGVDSYLGSKVNLGEPVFENGKLSFSHINDPEKLHPDLKDAKAALSEKRKALAKVLEEKDAYKTALDKIAAFHQADAEAMQLAVDAATFHPDAANADRNLVEKITGALETHAKTELKAAEAAHGKVSAINAEVHEARVNFLSRNDFDVTKVKGVTAENKEAATKAVKAHIAENKKLASEMEKTAGKAVKEGGFVSRLGHNIGGAAWKESKVKAGFRTAGTVVGLGAMVDATLRSKRPGEDGQIQNRSAVRRGVEFVLGAALAGGSALAHGR